MATGTIVKAWKDSTTGYMAVKVGEDGVVEYIGVSPLLNDAEQPKSVTKLKQDLVASVKEQRDRQLASVQKIPISGIDGTVPV